MLGNYLKIALRNLWKNKGFSAINIIGLASGLAVCLLIVLYVVDELSYDRYNKNAVHIYRVEADLSFNGTRFNAAVTPEPLAAALKRDYPQVIQVVRIAYQGDILVKKGAENIKDQHAAFVDSTFFEVFTVPALYGNTATALNEPTAIVIDATTARKYFNSTDVVGRTLRIDNTMDCKVTAVIKDMPLRSHFHFSFLRPRGIHGQQADAWLSNNIYSYILMQPGITKPQLQQMVNKTINNYLAKDLEAFTHSTLGELEKSGNRFQYPVTALTDIHLRSSRSYELEPNGDISYVYIFSVVALFILLIACVNFMNLSTARSAGRAKEVGIRKVAGSLRSHLVIQFLTESVLLSFLSLVLAIGIAALLMPWFNQLSGKGMQVQTVFSTWLFPVMIALVFIVGCVAGSYPAFYLSSFQPIQVLKGKMATGFKGSRLRSILVVFQFSISIVLIIGTMIIYNQLEYIRNRKIGYNRDQVLVLHNAWYLDKQIKSFNETVRQLPGVENITLTGDVPTSTNFDREGWFKDASFDASKAAILANFYVDENYVPTLGMEIVQGRNFSKSFLTDSSAVMINEAAVKELGLKDPLKETLYRPDGDNKNYRPHAYHIIGVVKDFNYASLHDKIDPVIIQLAENRGAIAVRLRSSSAAGVIEQIKKQWNNMAPGQPFQYTFMDADFNTQYNTEQRTGKLFITFAVFAILIGCLGLFGLVTYAAEQRTKEIGVRKILGASVGGIVALLSKDFAKLVLISSLIAFPVAWWIM
ncbi:MAG TPA: ABC transporter permease, partial [Chitinophagaceae bacterium]|nr:ABC transporter permease [Chitinophagaceae bacterium]